MKSVLALLAGVLLTNPTASASDNEGSKGTTKVEPYLTYRWVALSRRPDAVYARKEHKDVNDQIYATLKFSRTVDYVHHVVLEPSFRSMRTNPRNFEWLLEQAYIDTAVSETLQLTAGKKVEYEGPGFMVNPSDLLNQDKDLFDPVYQNEGVLFARLAYRHDEFNLGLGIIPNRGQDRQESLAWLTASAFVLDIDTRVQMTYHPRLARPVYGLSLSRFFGSLFEVHFDGQYRTYQRSPNEQGDRLDLAFRCDFGQEPGKDCFSSYGRMDPSAYYLVGTRMVLTPRRSVIAEYITQQSGMLPDQFEAYYDTIRADKESDKLPPHPPTTLRGRHYAFASYQDADTLDGLHFGISGLMNTDDRSSFIIGSVKHHFSEITSIEFSPNYYLGSKNSEFGEAPFASAFHLVFRGRF